MKGAQYRSAVQELAALVRPGRDGIISQAKTSGSTETKTELLDPGPDLPPHMRGFLHKRPLVTVSLLFRPRQYLAEVRRDIADYSDFNPQHCCGLLMVNTSISIAFGCLTEETLRLSPSFSTAFRPSKRRLSTDFLPF